MDEALLERLLAIEAEHESVLELLADPAVLGDSNRYREISIRHGELKHVVDLFRSYRANESELREAEELLTAEDDTEMREYLDSVATEKRTRLDALGLARPPTATMTNESNRTGEAE